MIIKHSFLLFLLICTIAVSSQTVFAEDQFVQLSGLITDSETNELLKFVTIKAVGKITKGAVTSKQGTYLLKLPKGEYEITCSMVGYSTIKKNITLTQKSLVLDVQLHRSAFRASDIIVSAEDPGSALMRKVIEKKNKWRDSLQSYSYMLYTKFVVSADTLTAGRSSGRNDTSIFSILESYSKGYFEKPDKYFNEIIQKRQTANIPPQANFVAFGTNINLYDDMITITGEEVSTPFHPDAHDFYDFVLKGIIDEDNDSIAQIQVIPKSNQRRLLSGMISIDVKTKAPLFADLQPNRAVKLPFDASFLIQQSFQEFDSKFTLPVSLKINSSLSAEILFIIAPRIDLAIETIAYDYVINPTLPSETFEKRRVEINEKANIFDTVFWEEKAVLPLKSEEKQAYEQIQKSLEDPDSLATSALNSLLGDVSKFFQKLQQRPFTGFENMFRYNRVHGLYTGIGLQFTQPFNAETGVQAGYGWADNHLYAEAFHRQYLNNTQKYFLELSAYRKLARRDNPYVVGVNGINTLSLFFRNDYGDYFYNDGTELAFEYGWGQLRFLRREEFIRPSAIRVSIRREFHASAQTNSDGKYTILNAEYRQNFTPMRRISTAGFIITGQHALQGISKHSYSQATFQSFLRFTTLPLWRMDMRISSGWSWGDIPPQEFYSLESSVASTAGDGVLRGMNVKEFYGDRYVALSAEHSFGEVIPGVLRIPSIASFGIEFILTGSVGWTEFSKNALRLVPLPSTSATGDCIYYEAGIALNRLFLFFRTDLSARFSQRATPELRFTVSGATF